MADSQLLTIILIASVAGFFLFRLSMVLGRRTGHERPPQEGYRLGPGSTEATAPPPQIVRTSPDRPTDPVASGLFDIGLADRSFDREQFLSGARAAYEAILTAFASGDRVGLKALLSDEVYTAFESAIAKREADHQTATLTLVGFGDVKIIAAQLKNSTAEITIAFDARLISSTCNAAGVVVEGDATKVEEVTDVWTFTRDVRSRDPNWLLISTTSEPR